MCGESWHAMKDSLTHRPSSQGWAPGVLPFFVQVFCLSPVCTWMEGWGEEGGYLLHCFFSIIYILGLVCYKHTIHGPLELEAGLHRCRFQKSCKNLSRDMTDLQKEC